MSKRTRRTAGEKRTGRTAGEKRTRRTAGARERGERPGGKRTRRAARQKRPGWWKRTSRATERSLKRIGLTAQNDSPPNGRTAELQTVSNTVELQARQGEASGPAGQRASGPSPAVLLVLFYLSPLCIHSVGGSEENEERGERLERRERGERYHVKIQSNLKPQHVESRS